MGERKHPADCEPDEPGYWPTTPTSETTVRIAHVWHWGGRGSLADACELVTGRRKVSGATRLLERIMAYAWYYDFDVDEHVIDRAMAGDGSVLVNATQNERLAIMDCLYLKYEMEPYPESGEESWVTVLARQWGVDGDRLRGLLTQRAARKRAA